MKKNLPLLRMLQGQILEKLGIRDSRFVEIESKKRVLTHQAEKLKCHLIEKRRLRHVKSAFSLDQFLDTPQMDLFKKGVSLRLRYKRNGSEVYLQYKGPGFRQDGLLYRSEFSSPALPNVTLEESHHDMIHFNKTSIQDIVSKHLRKEMVTVMKEQLGADVISRISVGPILCAYQKEKFKLKIGASFLEPSLDRVFAFHINRNGLHPLSTFWEYENEVKSDTANLQDKIEHLPNLLDFEKKISSKFDLKVEPLDKYHRCTSIFLKK